MILIPLQVIWKYFYSRDSAGEHGTLYQLRNLIKRTNVVSDPANNFNACNDFLNLITTCQILTASLQVLGMESLSDVPSSSIVPSKDDLISETPTCRKETLKSICCKVVERFIKFQFNPDNSDPISSEPQSSAQLSELRPSAQSSKPQPSAQSSEPQPSAQSSEPQPSAQSSEFRPSATKPRASASKPRASASKPRASASKPRASASKPRASVSKPLKHADGVHEYTVNLLGMGCLYMEFADAIKEGDGDRVIRCWRYLLPVFKSSDRKNYSIEAFNLLNQYEYQLTPRQSAQLAWNRFINTNGVRGRNIPCDLHQEHLNRICKRAIRHLGANQTETAITRAGKVLGTLYPVLMQYDMQTHVSESCGIHRAPSNCQKDRDTIIRELQRTKVFSTLQDRKYRTFPRPRDPLHAKSISEVLEWITKHIVSIDKNKS